MLQSSATEAGASQSQGSGDTSIKYRKINPYYNDTRIDTYNTCFTFPITPSGNHKHEWKTLRCHFCVPTSLRGGLRDKLATPSFPSHPTASSPQYRLPSGAKHTAAGRCPECKDIGAAEDLSAQRRLPGTLSHAYKTKTSEISTSWDEICDISNR